MSVKKLVASGLVALGPSGQLSPRGPADRRGVRPADVALRAHPGQVTVEAVPGDAVVIDYRLLHGTHPNAGALRRDCVIANFAPSWRDLPDDLRAHLVSHCALPGPGEAPGSAWWAWTLPPRYDGIRRDLPLSRSAPAEFEIPPDGTDAA